MMHSINFNHSFNDLRNHTNNNNNNKYLKKRKEKHRIIKLRFGGKLYAHQISNWHPASLNFDINNKWKRQFMIQKKKTKKEK